MVKERIEYLKHQFNKSTD